MQLPDIFCYTLLMITMTEPWAHSEKQIQLHIADKQEHLMSRRDSSVLIDPPPGSKDMMVERHKVIYRRVSKNRQAPRAKYGLPKTKYGPPRSLKKPGKGKYRGKPAPKRPYHHNKLRTSNPPRLAIPAKWQKVKATYRPSKHYQTPSYLLEGLGFAEPPLNNIGNLHKSKTRYASEYQPHNDNYNFMTKPEQYESKPNYQHMSTFPTGYSNEYPNRHPDLDFEQPNHNEYQSPKPSYGEPPVDSYGAPIKASLHDLTHPPQDSVDNLGQDFNGYDSNNHPWQSFVDTKFENSYANSKKHHAVINPNVEVYSPFSKLEEPDDEQNLNSYSDIYNSRQVKNKKKKKISYYENVKVLNHPWTGNSKNKEEEVNDEIIVGGQYAEPPARYVPKSPGMEEDFKPPGYTFPETVQTPTISSYVNYKNSNLAFSPQNLNDVFSIVDK